MGTNRVNNQFSNWDMHQPYPKTAEGKAAYESALQAWWNRNGFNARATEADLLPLTPGTLPAGSRECFACGRNNPNDSCFPHPATTCPITPKVPAQENQWWSHCGYRARMYPTLRVQPRDAQIQQVEEYMTYNQETTTQEAKQGNGQELSV